MINLERLEQAINIMERASSIYMPSWQACQQDGKLYDTEEELHTCGNSACFGGWIAVSPEFQQVGGTAVDGIPHFKDAVASDAILKWLEVGEIPYKVKSFDYW